MKTLFLSPVPLDLPVDGCKLRGIGFLRGLQRHGPVDLLHFSERDGTSGMALPPPPSDLERLLSPVPSLIRVFSSPAFGAEVVRRSRDIDLCFCLGLQMLQYARYLPPGIPVVLDNFNVESNILLRLAQSRRGLKRLYWLMQTFKLWVWERLHLRRATSVIAISEDDRRVFSSFLQPDRISVIPPGLWLEPNLAADKPARASHLVFVGALDWHVNQDAVGWLVSDILPVIRRKVPEATLSIVGKRPSSEVLGLASHPGVTVHADVPEVVSFLREASAVVAPIRYGSGVNNKVLEALATGRPVVTTPVGAEGIQEGARSCLLVSSEAEEFAGHCVTLLCDHSLAEQLGQRSRDAVRIGYSEERLHRDLDQILRQLHS